MGFPRVSIKSIKDLFTSLIFELFRTLMCEHNAYGLEENLEVKAEAPVVNVFEVELYDFIEVLDVGAAADLPHAGEARRHLKPAAVVLIVLLEF